MTDHTLASRYAGGMTFEHLLETTTEHRELWHTLYKRSHIRPELIDRIRAVPGRWHLLILSEDWCGDSINTVPLLARIAERAPNVDARLLSRDANPDLMDAHLTGTSRSIPAVMLLDEEYRERAWWGPRPAPLQRWVLEHGLALPKEERYREARTWYARDRGVTTVEEITALLERAAGVVGAAEPVR